MISTQLNIISKNKLFDGGSGTISNPYRIVKKYHLDNIRIYPTASYKLENDIVFTDEFEEDGEYYNNGLMWRPIPIFSGRFDGNGFNIIDIKTIQNRTGQGLFTNSLSGRLENIKFLNVSINIGGIRYNDCGGIVGTLSGLLEGIYVTGNMILGTWCGGLTRGGGHGVVKRCGVNARVDLNEASGGLVGRYPTRIENSYMVGHTSGSNHHGGMIGSGYLTTVTNSYVAGRVQGNHLRRAIISNYDNNSGPTINSYFDTEVTMTTIDGAGGFPRLSAEMQYPYNPDIFVYDNWDFENIWAHDVDGTINNGYPYLREVTPINN